MIENSLLILGSSGTGKTFSAKQLAGNNYSLIINLNDNSIYENLVKGIGMMTEDCRLSYTEKEQVVLSFLRDAANNLNEEFYLILDDIHRGDITHALGELIYALRNRNSTLSLKDGTQITVIDNVKVIATCNSGSARSGSIKNVMPLFDKIEYAQNDLNCYQSVLTNNGLNATDPIYVELTNLYKNYTKNYCVFTSEYKQLESDYKLGFAYFLPSFDLKKEYWIESVYHKIRHQVLPLLLKYADDGIIKRQFIPHENTTDTKYVCGPIAEKHIEFIDNLKFKPDETDFLNYEKNCFDQKKRTPLPIGIRSKINGSHTLNWTYLVAIPIIRDMIEFSLINQHDLMDIFLYDNDVLCFESRKTQTAPNGQSIASLFVAEKYVKYFPSNDNADGNAGVYMYRDNLYKFAYNNQVYLMFSAFDVNGKSPLPYEINKCIRDKSRADKGQGRPLFHVLKMLVYKYLCKYKENLLAYRREYPNYGNLTQLEADIDFVKSMTTDDKHKGKPYFFQSLNKNYAVEFVFAVRNLPTWQMMKQKKYNGVYRIMSSEYKKIMDATKVGQMVLQGPPGTSKTYSAKKFISDQIGIRASNWEKLIENYHLLTKDDEYEKPQLNQPIYWDIVQFHPSYTYEDFVRGIAVFQNKDALIGKITGEKDDYELTIDTANSIGYKSVNKVLGKIAKLAAEDYNAALANNSLNSCPDYYLIIDEINRANLAVVFGELIYALEYRGEEGKIKTPYVVDGDDSLILPPNLYIIGTMNTADKSIGSIDYAIRRRFLFFKLLPDVNVIIDTIKANSPSDVPNSCTEVKLFYLIDLVFDTCLNVLDYQREDVQLGHTYFLRKSNTAQEIEDQMKFRFLYQVVPIISEYIRDGVLDFSKKAVYNSTSDEFIILEKFEELLAEKGNNKENLYDDLLDLLSTPNVTNLIDEFIKDA